MNNRKKAPAFLADEDNQDSAAYALPLCAVAVIVRYRTKLIVAFNQSIAALHQTQSD